jgi:outer membrane cobalamin receptor
MAGAAAVRAAGVADTVTTIAPIQVTGTRPLDGARSTTTSMRLDRARLGRFIPGTANDALASLPGVDLVKTGPWASHITLRGLGGDRVLMLVDGVRLNGVRGHGSQSSLVSVEQLDAVEVQPGASSAQFGSDALGGVVQFSTHRSLIDSRAAALLSIQTRATTPGEDWGASTRLGLIGPRAGLELALGAGGLDALVTPQGREPRSGYRQKSASGRVAAVLGKALLDYEHTWTSAYDIGLPAFHDTLGSHAQYPLQSRDLDRFELTSPGRGVTPDAHVLASLQDGHTEFDETTVAPWRRLGRTFGYNITDAWDRVKNRAVSVQPSVQWPRLAGLRVSGEYRNETTRGPRTTVTITQNLSGATTNTAAGVGESMPSAWRETMSGAAMLAPVWRRWRLEAGVRYDHVYSSADSTNISLTPHVAVADSRWSMDGGLARPFGPVEPYVHLSSGFRAPNLEERFYHDEVHGGMVVFGEPDLRSERSRSAEAGVRLSEMGFLQSARFSAYRSDVRDLITIKYFDVLYGRPEFMYANVDQARIDGIEGQMQWKLRRVMLGLYGTLPRARDPHTGDKIADAGTARATVDLSFPVPRLIPYGLMAIRVRWNDAVTGLDSTFARPAFSTTSIELSSLIVGVRVSVAVRNLMNHDYREPLSYISEPGRSVAFSLRRDLSLGLPFLRKKDS